MAWFKIDDTWWAHPKTLELTSAAIALWVRAGSWASQQLTDGHIPIHVLPIFSAGPEIAAELVTVGYWDAVSDGWKFHDWDEYQPTRNEVHSRRKQEADRKATWRAAKTAKSQQDKGETESGALTAVPLGHVRPAPDLAMSLSALPDPTRPDRLTTPTDVGVVARGARIPDDFTITDQMRAWAAERCPGVDIDLATEKFVNYWQARPGKNGTKLDWFATWRNWLLSDFERLSAQRGPLPPKVTAAERAFALTQKFRKEENNEDFPNVRVVDGHGSD
ncbi:MAG: hypothetical protein B5766_08265 [Candidatus Lumbricidophila eiseniae]|uniref:DnaT DNA-binding domain-containing protein n=1 Tax=Candidatus Lumbricidiphila eiseniae TaxID=1969409 RepID=A0A2A6FQ22_9MICO|nr:MAG: hypothetical protein B5766_08265 [Candidatus Lumbricidophila eiseniae]